MSFVPSRKASEILGVHPNTLRSWESTGKIKAIRTPSNQRLYDVTSITVNKETPKKSICYCRVSSAKQKDDLQRQINYLKEQFPNYDIITDIGSGLNFKRKGLQAILELAMQKNIKEVVVAHRDRLCRFGFDLIQWIIEKNQGKLVVLNEVHLSQEEELTEDLLSIVHVFSCRINGGRKYKKGKSKIKIQDGENIS